MENVAKFNNVYDKMQWITSAEKIEKEISQNNDKVMAQKPSTLIL